MTPHDAFCDALAAAYPRRQMFSIEELAEFFACSRDSVVRKMKAAGVAVVECPGGLRVPKPEVFKMVNYTL